MRILLINPPNCGRSIPEERYGITSLKAIMRGEPLSLEVLAGCLTDREVMIVDLKVETESLSTIVEKFRPELVGITGMTCEANTVRRIASEIKSHTGAMVVVGGIHASNCPDFFNIPAVDYIIVGLGSAAFKALVDALAAGCAVGDIPGVVRTNPGRELTAPPKKYTPADLMDPKPPAYHLVSHYRNHYFLPTLGLEMGFVVSAYGCPYRCDFCAIRGQAGGQYLTRDANAVIRDIRLLESTPVIRLVDANTFGNPEHSRQVCRAILEAGIRKGFIIDIRADSVVRDRAILEEWKKAGLRAVIIGFEEIEDKKLHDMNKQSSVSIYMKAISILRELGISIVGDFIIDPDTDGRQFDALERFIRDNAIELPMFTIMTPLPGTPLYEKMKSRITEPDLDYYTLVNAVVPTRMEEKAFYRRYSDLITAGHRKASL